MRNIDTSAYSSEKPSRITPDTIDLGNLPPIEKPLRSPQANNSELPPKQVEQPTPLEGSTVFSKPPLSTAPPAMNQSPTNEVGPNQNRHEEKHFNEPTTERNSERTEFRTEYRSENAPALFPRKRRTTRYSFEFYEDQILTLKEVKHRAEMSGEKVTLSDIAREALDQYLKDKDF